MAIFTCQMHDLQGKLVGEWIQENVILDSALNYLCNGPGNNFNVMPRIGVGTSDVTPDTSQKNLIAYVLDIAATFTPGVSSPGNTQGDKTFTVTATFAAN